MDKLKKVIQAFENCTAPEMNDDDETCVDCIRAAECSWDDCQERDSKLIDIPLSLAMATMEVLKAQEPHVMTLEEVKALPIESDVWVEITGAKGSKPMITATTIHGNGEKEIFGWLQTFNFAAYGKEIYGWRCWTSRPTDEQRRETPWAE